MSVSVHINQQQQQTRSLKSGNEFFFAYIVYWYLWGEWVIARARNISAIRMIWISLFKFELGKPKCVVCVKRATDSTTTKPIWESTYNFLYSIHDWLRRSLSHIVFVWNCWYCHNYCLCYLVSNKSRFHIQANVAVRIVFGCYSRFVHSNVCVCMYINTDPTSHSVSWKITYLFGNLKFDKEKTEL